MTQSQRGARRAEPVNAPTIATSSTTQNETTPTSAVVVDTPMP